MRGIREPDRDCIVAGWQAEIVLEDHALIGAVYLLEARDPNDLHALDRFHFGRSTYDPEMDFIWRPVSVSIPHEAQHAIGYGDARKHHRRVG